MRQTPHTASYEIIDRHLGLLGEKLRIIHFLNPTNLRREKRRFFASLARGRPYNPQFHYPPIPRSIEQVRKKLEAMKIPTNSAVGKIMEMKRIRLLGRVALLKTRGGSRALQTGYILYGTPSRGLVRYAAERLKALEYAGRETGSDLSSCATKRILRETLKNHGLVHWSIREKKNLAARVGISNKQNSLFIRQGERFSRADVDRLIAHEIETHIFRVENGRLQPPSLFAQGFPGLETTEEGLAVWNELRVPHSIERQRIILARTLAVAYALKGSFLEVFTQLSLYRLDPESVWDICVRVKRGLRKTETTGAFTKDFHYLKGYLEIQRYIKRGGDLAKLYMGKIGATHVPILAQFPSLVPPRHLPPHIRLRT